MVKVTKPLIYGNGKQSTSVLPADYKDGMPSRDFSRQMFLASHCFAAVSVFTNLRIVSVNTFASMTSRRRARNSEIY